MGISLLRASRDAETQGSIPVPASKLPRYEKAGRSSIPAAANSALRYEKMS